MNKGVYGLPKSRTYESGYKIYTALITQVSTDPPVAKVLENTIGQVWWSYQSTGIYKINSDRLFPFNKTYVDCKNIFGNQWGKNIFPSIEESSQPNSLTNKNWDYTIPDLSDGFDTAIIEIRVYI